MNQSITIAVCKGRILTEVLPLLASAGVVPQEDPNSSRKLVFDTEAESVRIMIVRGADAATYVRFGAADLGIMGKDQLMEEGGDGMYELADLHIARCRLVVAEPQRLADHDDPANWQRLRIATKYPNITRRYLAAKGIQTEAIKLYGSMELAPLAGLADRIVDLVDTGNTLKANGLVEMEQVAQITSRLVANPAAMKLKQPHIGELADAIAEAANAKS
ncbi:MAG: ATP phosphoribosyltransferase [Gammaproteobacteria bacterium]|nr:ATP phosphoribosyltransferase [Gammaproteobacteria bacterium]